MILKLTPQPDLGKLFSKYVLRPLHRETLSWKIYILAKWSKVKGMKMGLWEEKERNDLLYKESIELLKCGMTKRCSRDPSFPAF